MAPVQQLPRGSDLVRRPRRRVGFMFRAPASGGSDPPRAAAPSSIVARFSDWLDHEASSCNCRRSSRSIRSPADSSSRVSPPTGSICASALTRTLGAIFFWANVLAGISALSGDPAWRPHRPHPHDGRHALPSNMLLILVPLMPTLRSRADAPAAIQHQPDGRADATVLHDGRRSGRRASAAGGSRASRGPPARQSAR